MGRKTKIRNEVRPHYTRKASPKMNVDVEELLESCVIFANDGSSRKRIGLKTREAIQQTPPESNISSAQNKIYTAQAVSRSTTKSSINHLQSKVSVVAGSKLSVLVTKLDPEKRVIPLKMNEEVLQNDTIKHNFAEPDVSHIEVQMNEVEQNQNLPLDKSRGRGLSNSAVLPHCSPALGDGDRKNETMEEDTGKNTISNMQHDEKMIKIEPERAALLSPKAIEEELKSPDRTKFLLKQLESTLSPKFTEPSKENSRHVSRYGRIQKQKENDDYIPLDVAKFIIKSSPKAKVNKVVISAPSEAKQSNIETFENTEFSSVPIEEPVLAVVSVENPLLSLAHIEEHPGSIFEEPIPATVSIEAQLPTLLEIDELPTPIEDIGASVEISQAIDDTIIYNHVNSEILGIDQIKIVGLDTSFGTGSVSIVESPAKDLVKKMPPIPLEKISDVDSAIGSSIDHDLQTLNEEYKLGQLYWGALSGKSMHWPCMIRHDPKTNKIVQLKNNKYFVHVAFFADNGRHSWIARSMLMPFEGLDNLKAIAENEPNLKKKLKDALRNRTIWMEAVRQAEDMLQYPTDFREQRFRTLVELEKSQPIRKRSKSLSAGYHSNSFGDSLNSSGKRHRSPTPESPAFEPIVPTKRIKLEQDDSDLLRNTISRYFQSMNDGSDLLETASGTSSECDDISEMAGFDRTAYNNLLNMSRMYVFEGQTEAEIDKKLQKYVQKICSLRTQQSAVTSKGVVNGRMSSRLRSQALRNSFLKFGEELGIGASEKETNFSGASPGPSSPKVKKEPLTLEQSFIFKLEKNYLMKGVPKGFVCAVCYKPNDVSKCSKCHNHYHPGCLADQAKTIAEFEKANESRTFICLNCREQKPHICFVCKDGDVALQAEQKHRCMLSGCGKYYHIPCLRLFPQHKLTSTANTSTLFCPYHTCHTCVSDDPRSNVTTSKGQLIRCIKCPSSYHTDAKCIPAGSQILSTAALICPKHSLEQCSLNVNWCFLCCKGGSLICCDTCPTAFHLDCLKFIPPEGKYICEECESGRMPLYNEVVWAKYSNFRFWPALTVPPPAIPDSVLRWQHEGSDICILFFGSRDYGWINRRRIYLYQEGDSDSVSERKNAGIKARYNEALREARLVHEMLQAKKADEGSDLVQDSFVPPMYVKIKSSKYIPPLKQPTYGKDSAEDNVCECSPSDADPCGPDSNCINRALMIECNPKSCPTRERCQNQCFEKKKYPSLAVKRIPCKGWGLFAMEDIAAGKFVIEYVGEVINNVELARRVQQKKEQKDENWYFLTVDSELTIDAGPKGNLARFINHSCEPNCVTMLWNVNGAQSVGLFALTDVKSGEELTFNYNFESTGDEKKICHCGASKCSGFIGKKYRPPVGDEELGANGKRRGKLTVSTKRKIKRRKSTVKKKRKSTAVDEKPLQHTQSIEQPIDVIPVKQELLDTNQQTDDNVVATDS
ncbi:nuclear receptor binding SET domain protein isoform X2 [Wyeomyia smithii]|uniref:nuclear receptor binding SET domain protein isoform X2 n=1 Tax=Wyeomyia smithii TaxID=174621 RepID=UPI002467BA5D|nr:nuclear receptor binding SET domain protein isoform X2 [Wyeomyia smithii]